MLFKTEIYPAKYLFINFCVNLDCLMYTTKEKIPHKKI